MGRPGNAARGRGRQGGKEVWWSQWPVAILLGLASLCMVLTGALPIFLYALLTAVDNQPSGTDVEFQTGPGGWVRLGYVLLGVVFVAIPGFTTWAARRRLLGFLLLALIASVLVMCWGLAMLGIL